MLEKKRTQAKGWWKSLWFWQAQVELNEHLQMTEPHLHQEQSRCLSNVRNGFPLINLGFYLLSGEKIYLFLGNMLSQIGQLVKKSGNWWKHQKENYRILASPAAAILGQSSSMSPSDGQGGTGLHKVDQPEDSGQGISSCRWDPRHKVFILHKNNWLFLHWECYEMNHVFQIHMLKP